MRVYVETNFVLELALQQEQHAACEAILQLAEARQIALVLPAYSWWRHPPRYGVGRSSASTLWRRSIASFVKSRAWKDTQLA